MMQIGTLCCGLSMFLVGPAEFIPDSLLIMAIGQFLYVLFSAFMFLYALPEIIFLLNERFPNQEEKVGDVASALYNFAFGSGQLLSPLFGSLVTYLVGFRMCSDIIGIL